MGMRLAIVGSRRWKGNIEDLECLEKELKLNYVSEIVSGGAKGIDTAAEKIAKKHGITLKVFKPDYDRYGRSAPLQRNTLIVNRADKVVAFVDDESRGTLDTIKKTKAAGKRLKVVHL